MKKPNRHGIGAVVLLLSASVVSAQLAWRNVDPGQPYVLWGGYDVPGDPAHYLMGLGYPATLWKWDSLAFFPGLRDTAIAGRAWYGLAYDRWREAAVLFGGYNVPTSSYVNDTWLLAGGAWTRVTPASSPSPRESPSAFENDSSRARVVLHGGLFFGRGPLNDTWEWDGRNWNLMNPPPPVPPLRWYGDAAYDEGRGVTVLFGGCDGLSQPMNDTWEWDGTHWSARATSGPRPPPRFYHAMAYDTRRQVVQLCGGMDTTGQTFADLWEWDGTQWTERTDAPLPVARAGHMLLHNGTRGVSVLVGGSSCAVLSEYPQGIYPPRYLPSQWAFSRIWEFDGRIWTEKTSPNHIFFAHHLVASYDHARASVVLYGARSFPETCSTPWPLKTWEWKNGAWTNRTPASGPPDRDLTALSYDERRGVTVLFGGVARGGFFLADTWEWDGTAWTLRADGPPGPRAREGHAMTYDSRRGVTVMVGGYIPGEMESPETWEWDGTTWRLAGMMADPRAGRTYAAFAYDRRRGVCVLFGGRDMDNRYLTDVWEWDGQTWLQKTPQGPRPMARRWASMVFDDRRGATVLAAGLAYTLLPPPSGNLCLGDVWEWDGATWTQVAVPSGAAPGKWPMVYDRARDAILVTPSDYRSYLGGWAGPPTFNDTWVLEDTSRLRIDNPEPPPGGSATLAVRFPGEPGRPFLAGASFGIYPGIGLPDGRIVPLNLDLLCLASLGANSPVFSGFSGNLDGRGEARFVLNIPSFSSLSGIQFYAAAVSVSGSAVASISNPVRIRIR